MVSDKKRKKKITGYRIFSWINIGIMLLVIFVTAYPIYYVIVASVSSPAALYRHFGALWYPLAPYTFSAYKSVLGNPQIATGFANTLFILVVGVSINIILTMIGGFFLTLKGPMLRKLIATMIIFTMYFGGGLVPAYLNVKELKLINTLWALIIPGAVNTVNLIIMRTAFESIPDSLIESARLDGASYLRILTHIMIPLSKATIAVLVLYYGVGHWNSWFSASVYLQDSSLYPLQLVVHRILDLTRMNEMTTGADISEMAQTAELIKYALIVVTTVPVLVIYPFVQKYFTKGVMIGAVKG